MDNVASTGRVLVTRPQASAAPLHAALARAGWDARSLPMLVIEPLSLQDNPALLAPLARPAPGSIAIFISVNAVRATAELLAQGGTAWPGEVLCTGIGAATLAAIDQQGWPRLPLPEPTAEDANTSESLLQRMAGIALQDAAILLFCGVGGRDALQTSLAARGARVSRIETYRRCKPDYETQAFDQLIKAFLDGPQAARYAMLFASGETLANFCEFACGGAHWTRLRDTVVIVPSDRVGELAGSSGFRNIRVSANASDKAFLRELASLQSESL